MSKKKESPNKYERASENLREFLDSNRESFEKSGKAIKKLSDKVNELSDKANEPIQYYPIESVCVGDGSEHPILNHKDVCSNKCCYKDEIKLLRKELSDLRRSYNGYKGAMKQANRERDAAIEKIKSRDKLFDKIMHADRERVAKVRELANDISIHDNCIMNLHGRLEELEEKEQTSLFRKRDLIWWVVLCITVVSLVLISAYFK